ncbi:hypothetical protein HNY73_010892 [Argiope bruennichi]|uniref:Uncharacterized protein n=1 Tax=Argiope bruennichi TaxID=94029 RepID=A0A8T0F7B5_ARGBR|nr:hypothetical protein HNY73_010892 [Argiope bruennichi]
MGRSLSLQIPSPPSPCVSHPFLPFLPAMILLPGNQSYYLIVHGPSHRFNDRARELRLLPTSLSFSLLAAQAFGYASPRLGNSGMCLTLRTQMRAVIYRKTSFLELWFLLFQPSS